MSDTSMLSADYIKALEFDYIATYSFNRLDPERAQELEELSKRRQDSRLPKQEMDRLEELKGLYNGAELLPDGNGGFNQTCERLSTFRANDPEIGVLKEILQMEITECMYLLCAPYYRDAIVFYKASGQLVSVLNVCLSCSHLKAEQQILKADFEVFDLLKKFFLRAGHRVEDPERFMMDQFGEMKAKFLAEKTKKNNE